MMRMTIWGVALVLTSMGTPAAELPSRYYQILDPALDKIAERLAAEPDADLEALEARPGWRRFTAALLVAAVLYAKDHPANPRYGDRKTLEAAFDMGDRIAAEIEDWPFDDRLHFHRDTYMWLESYRLLERELGDERRKRWRRGLHSLVTPLAEEVAKRQDHPWYDSPYLITSPNHFSLWTSTLYLAGHVFGNEDWRRLGAKVMHRFAAEEQTPDGYWGEHSRAGPTTGYDYLTMTGVALYWEHSQDPVALEALRRSTTFHQYFTYPNGIPVETVNDRNRYWGVSMWGQFGFSNFPDGRRYSEFLVGFYDSDRLQIESLGRIAQSALYYREGPLEPMPLDRERFVHEMSVPAGIRKAGPWVVCLSGIIATSTLSRFYLDRQSAISIHHEKLGQIISGANSKLQPELATFQERHEGKAYHLPMSSRLDMGERGDRLALAFNRFFSVLDVPEPSADEVKLQFAIHPKGGGSEATLTFQLALKEGQSIETGTGTKAVLGTRKIDWGPEDVGGEIRSNGWTIQSAAPLWLVWPVYPYNPYAYARETGLENAVGALSTELEPGAQKLSFTVTTQ